MYIVIAEFLDRHDNMRHCKVGERHEPHNEERARQLVELSFIEKVDIGSTAGADSKAPPTRQRKKDVATQEGG